jgi:hypothetical protein
VKTERGERRKASNIHLSSFIFHPTSINPSSTIIENEKV